MLLGGMSRLLHRRSAAIAILPERVVAFPCAAQMQLESSKLFQASTIATIHVRHLHLHAYIRFLLLARWRCSQHVLVL